MNIIEDITSAVFPEEDAKRYITRFEVLYDVVFQIAEDTHITQLRDEIITCEKTYAKNTMLEDITPDKITSVWLLETYSGIAYTLATFKLKNKSDLILARYLNLIYLQLLESEYLSSDIKLKFKRLISEALLDFNYACGNSENMSLRIYKIAAL